MSSLEFRQLAGDTFLAEAPTNIGAYSLSTNSAILIDSGNDDDAGRKILRALENEGLTLTCIANTHSNADHCGGNWFLQSRSGCRVAAPRLEASFVEHPELESALLWGGFPVPPLRNKFLIAKASRVTDYLDAPCDIPGTPIRAIPLPGHYLGQVGYITPDRVLFAADAAASPTILEKYKYYVVYDVAAQLATLDEIAAMDVEWVVASHAPPTRDGAALAAANKSKILEVGERIFDLIPSSGARLVSPEAIVTALAGALSLELNHTQYALLSFTVKSYISWLADRGEILTRVESNKLIVERK